MVQTEPFSLRENSLKSRHLVPLFLVAAVVLFSGCTSEEVQQFESNRLSDENSAEGFDVETTLCRKVSRKSGRRIGVGQEFKVSIKSYVRAFVDFDNVQVDRPYTVHLVWIRPDGKEMFRKYANVRLDQVQDDEYRTIISWLSAEDLHKVKSDTLLTAKPEFTLQTRLNISEKKAREPGLHHFRVYLDRRFLLEEPFTVLGPPVVAEADSTA